MTGIEVNEEKLMELTICHPAYHQTSGKET